MKTRQRSTTRKRGASKIDGNIKFLPHRTGGRGHSQTNLQGWFAAWGNVRINLGKQMGEMTTSQQKCRSALHPGTPASYCTGDSYGCPPNHNHQLQHYCHRFGSNRSSVSRLVCKQSGCLRTIQAVLRLLEGWWRWRQTHDICRACDRCLVGRSRSEPNPKHRYIHQRDRRAWQQVRRTM